MIKKLISTNTYVTKSSCKSYRLQYSLKELHIKENEILMRSITKSFLFIDFYSQKRLNYLLWFDKNLFVIPVRVYNIFDLIYIIHQ